MTSMSGAFAERIQTTVAYGDQRSSPALAEVRPTSECVRPSILASQISDLEFQISNFRSEISRLRDSSARAVAATEHGALDRSSAVAARRRARRRFPEGVFRLCLWLCAPYRRC